MPSSGDEGGSENYEIKFKTSNDVIDNLGTLLFLRDADVNRNMLLSTTSFSSRILIPLFPSFSEHVGKTV